MKDLYNRYNNNNNKIYQTIINNYNSRKPNNQVVKNHMLLFVKI